MVENDSFRLLFEHAGDSIFVVAPESETILDVNPAACRMLGYAIEELRGMKVSVIHPEEMHSFREFACEVEERGSARTENLYCTTKFGNSIPVEISASYVANVFGRNCMIAIARDISDRLSAQQEIQSLSLFPSENPFPVLRIDSDGGILFANSACLWLTDVLHARVHERVPADWCQVVERALKTGVMQELEVQWNDRVHGFFFFPITQAGYVNVYGQDITERKKALELLQESERRLRELNVMKNSFITMISHEMNTPLAVMSGALSMLADPRFDAEIESRKKFIGLAQRNHERLVRLCSDTIDVGQILAGTLRLEMKDVDIVGVVRSACGSLTAQAASRGVEITMALPEGPQQARIDPRRLEQAVRNLIRNAIEAARGRVVVRVLKEQDRWVIVVDDDGPGFDPDEMPHLFDIFTMGASKQKTGGGVGFGLPICKTIVELHGGRISLENRFADVAPDRIIGARLTIELPGDGPLSTENARLVN